MKVIDLLNKIAKGEKPNKIMFNNEEYLHIGNDYQRKSIVNDKNYSLFNDYYILGILDEEVEIIEEDKKIKKLNNQIDYEDKINYEILDKINELIDVLNKEQQ